MAKNIEQENSDDLPVKSELAKTEEAILSFWKESDIFAKTLQKKSPMGEFVFYEGPPTANGRPGLHHLEARAFKDIIPRYKTMRGFHVNRKGGWDTHGLPVELEVEKKLGLKSKKEIESYGIEKFNDECKKSVWTYVDEWKDFTGRIGYWIDMENPYVTYHTNYIESVWNILKKVSDDGHLYKDYKVVPWCPRCGTALSSHELAQGYADVKDLSVYAKFRIKNKESGENKDNTYILAWTTTPWTLPGNVALAIGKEIEYIEIRIKNKESKEENYILAKSRLSIVEGEYEIVREMKGVDLVGLEYEPLYPYFTDNLPEKQKVNLGNAFKVYEAGFVTTEDGTGVVHTAVMYGQDDFELGTKYNLPKFHLVDDSGHFTSSVGPFAGRFVKDEEVAVDVIKDLAHRGLLFKKEKHEHSYPFCWRCKTPLIYYARDSWYIRMSSLRNELIEGNKDIQWEPEYIREGRFGDWLREVKDWAISRERYWGTPLPIWEDAEGHELLVVDSIETLKKHTKKNNNTFIFVRHGEAQSNIQNIATSDITAEFHLTEKGKKDIENLGETLKTKNISAVYTSPFIRTQESTHILCTTLGLNTQEIKVEDRIREFNFGDFSEKAFAEYFEYKKNNLQKFDAVIPNGESFLDAKKRFGEFLYEVDSKHEGEVILVVTHGIGLEVVTAIIEGADMKRSAEIVHSSSFNPGDVLEFEFIPLPHNKNFELDLHKPFIDDVVLTKDGKEYKRVKEVLDVWFDSGAMPFAQHHYPFENKKLIDGGAFPADFISEAIDQTRGWFYTLHAVGVLLGRGKAYKNVICLGHILDKEGLKMSKSKGNVINPWEAIDTYGVDALRFWMYTVNQPGESKNFDPRTVEDITKKVFNLLENVVNFYELFAPERRVSGRPESPHAMDKWILALFDETVATMTKNLDEYRVLEAARSAREFIAELSQWYVRRSRDRFKSGDTEDKSMATATLGFVLEQFSICLAPFIPFFAEHIYQRVKTPDGLESVHLASWPEAQKVDSDIIAGMLYVKSFATMGLKLRADAKIPVRQPLASFSIKHGGNPIPHWDKLSEILKEELNVKEIILSQMLDGDVSCSLNTKITPELQKEGDARELMRAIQEKRKEKNLSPMDKIGITLLLTPAGKAVVNQFERDIKDVCGISDITIGDLAENSVPWFEIQF